jgi:4-hydroxy 2-oxovalerate aldolase
MLEIIDEYLNAIYSKHFWGYSLPFYLSASLDCHPNYANYYANKGTLSLKSFRELLKQIPKTDKENYSKDVAEHLYLQYLNNYIDDKDTLSALSAHLDNKKILVIAPGKNLVEEEEKIKTFIKDNDPIIISLNFISDIFKSNYLFSSNMRRYSKLQDIEVVKKIITSNIKDAVCYDYMVNFSTFSCENLDIIDNSGLMLIKLLMTIGIKQVFVAGMDGYRTDNLHNYCSQSMEAVFSEEVLHKRNGLIIKELSKISKIMNIQFVTTSLYV